MPLSHANSGKYLTKRFEELRNTAYEDESILSDQEKLFAETNNLPYKNLNRVGMWEIVTQPEPWYDSMPGKLVDVRRISRFDTESDKDKVYKRD
jgi:hypothetical protein